MARTQSCNQQTEVRENRGEETNYTYQGVSGGFPWYVLGYPTTNVLIRRISSEEFGIYLNYVRKLGFEETPDYDFLRELFAKVMKNNNDIDDGVFDWNLLNGPSPL
jgi:hypothetical protein